MYQTFKVHNGTMGSSDFVVHSSMRAADRIKVKKQPACARCKVRKLKCVVQEGVSCERCLRKKLRCSNEDADGARITIPEDDTNSGPSSSTHSSVTSPTRTGRRVSTASGDLIEGILGSCTSESPTDYLHVTHGTNASEIVNSTVANTTPDDFDFWTPALFPDLQTELYTAPSLEDQRKAEDSASNNEELCSCSELLMSANATIQIKMVWQTPTGSHPNSTPIDSLLQCQTQVLNSCEALIACPQCCSKSDLVVIVISMCREMVQATKLAVQVVNSIQTQDPTRTLEERLCFGAGGDSDTGSSRLDATGWELEHDEEVEMVKTLIKIRCIKLRKLIGQLQQVVSVNCAPYCWMVNTLLQTVPDV